MTLTYYRSATNEGGAIGDAITDGAINELFLPINVNQMHTGDTILDKMWVRPDVDGSMYVGVGQGSKFPAYVFLSANAGDTEADLAGTEARYGGAVVTGNPDGSTVEVDEDVNVEIWRSGDMVLFPSGVAKEIDTVSTASGTTTITFTTQIGTGNVGTWISSVFLMNMTASTDYPFWIDQRIPPGLDPEGDTYNMVSVLEMY